MRGATRAGAAVVAAVVICTAAAIFMRALGTRTNYDEGVYLASLEALRHGQRLGSDLYAIQPPAFYLLLRALAAPFGHSIEGIHAAFALVGVLGVGAAIAIGWRLYGAGAGLAAGALLAVAPPYPSVAPSVSADVPSIALGMCALALAAFATHPRPSRKLAAASGSVLALAVLVKFLAAPFVVPILALILSARSGRRLLPSLAGGAAATGAVFLIAYARALPELWQGIVSDHAGAKAVGSISRNIDWVVHLLDAHTPLGWLVPLGLVALVLVPSARRAWPLWTLVPASALFLVSLRPLADHHLALLSASYAIAAGPTLALAIGSFPRQIRVGATILLVAMLAAGAFQEQRRLHRNDVAEPAEVMWASAVAAAVTRPSDVVVTDLPVIAFRARRQIPGYLSDTSNTRVVSGALTTADVLRVLDAGRPPVVVVGRMFRVMPGLVPELGSRYPVRRVCGDVTVYLRKVTAVPLPACPT